MIPFTSNFCDLKNLYLILELKESSNIIVTPFSGALTLFVFNSKGGSLKPCTCWDDTLVS